MWLKKVYYSLICLIHACGLCLMMNLYRLFSTKFKVGVTILELVSTPTELRVVIVAVVMPKELDAIKRDAIPPCEL